MDACILGNTYYTKTELNRRKKHSFGVVEFHRKEKYLLLQWKPLNVITLGQNQTDNINRMITIGKLQQTAIFKCVGKQPTTQFARF